MEIKRPDWVYWKYWKKMNGDFDWETYLNEWFDLHVEPINRILKSGVEVFGSLSDGDFYFYDPKAGLSDSSCTHKALLIGIEPIKRETPADVLRDIVRDYDSQFGLKNMDINIDRAKKALEGEK